MRVTFRVCRVTFLPGSILERNAEAEEHKEDPNEEVRERFRLLLLVEDTVHDAAGDETVMTMLGQSNVDLRNDVRLERTNGLSCMNGLVSDVIMDIIR